MDLKNQQYPQAVECSSSAPLPVAQATYAQPPNAPLLPPANAQVPPNQYHGVPQQGNYGSIRHVPEQDDSNQSINCCSLLDGYYYKCILYHALNFLIGLAGMIIVSFGVPVGFGLLPVCCVGLIVLRIVHLLMVQLIKIDISVYNLMVPRHKRILIDEPLTSASGFSFVMAQDLKDGVSMKSLFALVYYGFIKFPLSQFFAALTMVSFVFGLLGALFFVFLIAFPFMDCVPQQVIITNDNVEIDECMSTGSALTFLILALFFLLTAKGIASCMTKMSMKLTRYFCTEKVQIVMNLYVPVAQVPVVRYEQA